MIKRLWTVTLVALVVCVGSFWLFIRLRSVDQAGFKAHQAEYNKTGGTYTDYVDKYPEWLTTVLMLLAFAAAILVIAGLIWGVTLASVSWKQEGDELIRRRWFGLGRTTRIPLASVVRATPAKVHVRGGGPIGSVVRLFAGKIDMTEYVALSLSGTQGRRVSLLKNFGIPIDPGVQSAILIRKVYADRLPALARNEPGSSPSR